MSNDLGTTAEAYLCTWLDHARTRVRLRTYEGYEGILRRYVFDQLPEIELRDLTPLHLQRLYAELLSRRDHPLSAGTVLNTHLVLTQAFAQAVRWGLIASN